MAPTEAEWETQKDTICSFYSSSTLVDTIDHMAKERNFIASKTSYEKKLREWKSRKRGIKESEWKYIFSKKSTRKEEGKDSQVLFHGNEISEKTIKKRKSRYTISELQMIQAIQPYSVPSPEGVIVYTPPNLRLSSPTIGVVPQDATAPNWNSITPIRNSVVKTIPTQNLPFHAFMDSMHHELRSFVLNSNRDTQAYEIDYSSIMSVHENEVVTPNSVIPILTDQAVFKIVATQMGYYNYESDVPPLPKIRCVLRNCLDNIYFNERAENRELRLQRLFGPFEQDVFEEVINLVIYMFSNNSADLRTIKPVLDWLLEQGRPVLKRMFASRLLTIQACLSNMTNMLLRTKQLQYGRQILEADRKRQLFRNRTMLHLRKVVEADSTELVYEIATKIFKNGLNINQLINIKDDNWKRYNTSILEFARSPEVANILIQSGANTKVLVPGFSPIGFRVHEGWSLAKMAIYKNNAAMMQFFVQHGSDIYDENNGPSCLHLALQNGNEEIVHFLLDSGVTATKRLQRIFNKLRNNFYLEYERHEATEFDVAVSTGSIKIVSRLLKQTTECIQSGPYYWLPLRDAARSGDLDMVDLLVSAGADVNAGSTFDLGYFVCLNEESWNDKYWGGIPGLPSTPLQAAVEGCRFSVVEYLLKKNADVNAVAFSNYGTSALETAKNLGNQKLVCLLTSYGAVEHLELTRDQSIAALRIATLRGYASRAKQLVESGGLDPHQMLDIIIAYPRRLDFSLGSEKRLSDFRSVIVALFGGHLELLGPIAQVKLFKEAVSYHDFETALMTISPGTMTMTSQLEMAGTLIKTKIPYFPLIDRQMVCLTKLCQEMNRVTGNPECLGLALQFASQRQEFSLIEELVSAGADVNFCGNREGACLHITLTSPNNTLEAIKYMISHGADVNLYSDYWYRGLPLNLAIENKGYSPAEVHKEKVQLLIENGAEINALDRGRGGRGGMAGRTALQTATSIPRTSISIVKLLLEHGADINAPPAAYYGVTAIQGAAQSGDLNIALLLLEHGADPNALGAKEHGRTALEGAAERGYVDMVQLLLNSGAEVTESAIQFAEKEEHFVIADLLTEHLRCSTEGT